MNQEITHCPTCGAELHVEERKHHVARWCREPGFHYCRYVKKPGADRLWDDPWNQAGLFEEAV